MSSNDQTFEQLKKTITDACRTLDADPNTRDDKWLETCTMNDLIENLGGLNNVIRLCVTNSDCHNSLTLENMKNLNNMIPTHSPMSKSSMEMARSYVVCVFFTCMTH